MVRADAIALPLADESVDLIVTSPPYSDADSVERLRCREAMLKFGRKGRVAAWRRTTLGPHGQERLGNAHAARPGAYMRHRPIANGLDHCSVALAKSSRGLSHRDHRFAIYDIGYYEPPSAESGVDLTQPQHVLGLAALDAQVRQQCLTHAPGCRRVRLPDEQRPSSLCCRFAVVAMSTERGGEQVDGFRRHLLDGDSGLVVRRPCAGLLAMDADVSVRIHHASHVGQL